MKHLLTFIIFTTLSANAFATHAYRSENCKSTTHNLDYKGNYPYGGMYGISLIGQDSETTALPQEYGETQTTLEDAEVIFKEVSSKITEDTGEVKECYFNHREWTSVKVVEISLISTDAAKNLGLHAGEKITFICEETTDYPNGNNCEDLEKED